VDNASVSFGRYGFLVSDPILLEDTAQSSTWVDKKRSQIDAKEDLDFSCFPPCGRSRFLFALDTDGLVSCKYDVTGLDSLCPSCTVHIHGIFRWSFCI
jgi:hypothetical protein